MVGHVKAAAAVTAEPLRKSRRPIVRDPVGVTAVVVLVLLLLMCLLPHLDQVLRPAFCRARHHTTEGALGQRESGIGQLLRSLL